jgi:Cu(I)/Ag(I) efflux system membrane fusion protein
MKNFINTKYFLLGLALLVGLLIGWFLKPSARLAPEETSKQESATEDLVYTCSMHPQIRKNEEGDCPICGMDLIPLASINSQLDPQAISMSATALQLAQVATIKVGTNAAIKTLRLNGKVQADERLSFTQSSHIPGRIEELSLNFTGEFIRKGQTIAKVYSPALVSAQEELLEAFKLREDQPALFLAAKERLKNWKLSDAQVEDIINSKKSIESFPILANVSGYVEKKMVKLGDYIKQGDALYQIVDLSKVWVLFDVYEADLAWLEQGDSLRFSLPSLADKNYRAVISYIDPLINPKTRVAQARVVVSNPDLKLKPEMLAQGLVQAEIASKSAVIVIPKSAIMWTGKSSVVYVMDRSQGIVNFKTIAS